MVGYAPTALCTENGGDSETYTKAVSLNRCPVILIKGKFTERQVSYNERIADF